MAPWPSPAAPFSLPRPVHPGVIQRAAALPLAGIEAALGLSRLNRIYDEVARSGRDRPVPFADRALDGLGISYVVAGEGRSGPPATGPVIVVANHPHGALDGLLVASLAGSVRTDFRLLGNFLLARIPEFRPLGIFVDPFGGPGRAGRNGRSLREAIRWLRAGGMLIIFPAGEVAHRRSIGGEIVEPAWHEAAARLAVRTGVPVVPVHIAGGNRAVFQVAGLLHPTLRTALLPRELLAQHGRSLTVTVGPALSPERLRACGSPAEQAAFLRLRTLGLAQVTVPRSAPTRTADRARTTVAPAVTGTLLARDVGALDSDRRLLASGGLAVYCARAVELPHVLPEIGRLREATFRAAGEGTGKPCDLDIFDRSYWHLFVWREETREVVGAYRIGPTDQVGAGRNLRRLYTRSLFKYGRSFVSKLGPALELGRSFVREEYQRDFSALMLLWKGIGQFVVRCPQYRCLFGPVSISADYRPASRELLGAALMSPRYRSSLAGLVSPKRPIETTSVAALAAHATSFGPEQLNDLVAEIEPDGKGMPVLLRQYLKLNAKLLAFSTDPDFGNVVDGLMVVDLLNVERSVLNRYMGREGAASFLGYHQARPAAGELESGTVGPPGTVASPAA